MQNVRLTPNGSYVAERITPDNIPLIAFPLSKLRKRASRKGEGGEMANPQIRIRTLSGLLGQKQTIWPAGPLAIGHTFSSMLGIGGISDIKTNAS